MTRIRPSWALEQGRMVGTFDPEEEVLFEITVPMSHDSDLFRIGWSLKGLRRPGWIAISTGQAVWSRNELEVASAHVLRLMEGVHDVVRGGVPEERR